LGTLGPALLGRYQRIMRGTLAGVLVVAVLLAGWQVSQRLEQEKALLAQRMEEHAAALEALVGTSAVSIRALQTIADLRFRTMPIDEQPSPLLATLMRNIEAGDTNLDNPPPPWRTSDVGNLTGRLPMPDLSLRRELEMALAMNSTLVAVRTNNPSAVSVYYTSLRHFTNLVPWVPSRQFRHSDEALAQEYVTLGLPAANPARDVFWTRAYMDDFGNGLMVTVGAPIYEGDDIRGTVALDITLAELERYLHGWRTGGRGELLLANLHGQVLASSARGVTQALVPLAGHLPASLRDRVEEVLTPSPDGLRRLGDHYVEALSLGNAPFRLVLVIPEETLAFVALRGSLIGIGFLLAALAVVVVVTTRLVGREFVRPAQQLVTFIEEESRGPALAMPDAHPAWRPWFETIRRVFNAHTQLVSLQQELDVARRMQQSILPTRFPQRPDLALQATMLPAKEVGGDFYDYFWLDEARIGLVIADVAGKGVPAALFMAVARTLLRATATGASGPAECLSRANDLLAKDNESATFVTVFYAILDTRSGLLRYANGGHNLPCLLAPDGSLSVLPQSEGIALGVMDSMEFEEGQLLLAPGSALLLYTDGVTEAFDTGRQAFGEERLAEVLRAGARDDAEALVARLLAAVQDFARDAPQADDITCLALRFHGPALPG
jgi:sigma-B regulation protein RsbU (phosphoserine phosphatase)